MFQNVVIAIAKVCTAPSTAYVDGAVHRMDIPIEIKTNPNKSIVFHFGFKGQLPAINININNVTLEWDKQVKYLDIVFDGPLSWTPYMDLGHYSS